MKILIRSSGSRPRNVDENRLLIEAIAQQMWKIHGRTGVLNWTRVELHLHRIVNQARSEARASEPARVVADNSGATRRQNHR